MSAMNDRFKMKDTFACNNGRRLRRLFLGCKKMLEKQAEALEYGGIYPRDTARGWALCAAPRRSPLLVRALSAPHQLRQNPKNEACSTLAAPSCGLFREKMLLPTALAEISFMAWQGEGCFF